MTDGWVTDCYRMPLTPKKQSKSGGSMNSSFQRYQEDTHDAWDDGDDDLLVRLKLDSQIIHSAANQVIESHNANEHGESAIHNVLPCDCNVKCRKNGLAMFLSWKFRNFM